eukprot:jgi/Psemu1/293660/fgenesh1_pg.3161_\
MANCRFHRARSDSTRRWRSRSTRVSFMVGCGRGWGIRAGPGLKSCGALGSSGRDTDARSLPSSSIVCVSSTVPIDAMCCRVSSVSTCRLQLSSSSSLVVLVGTDGALLSELHPRCRLVGLSMPLPLSLSMLSTRPTLSLTSTSVSPSSAAIVYWVFYMVVARNFDGLVSQAIRHRDIFVRVAMRDQPCLV